MSGWLSHGIASLFAAAGCPSGELAQRADKGIGPYGDTVGLAHFVGADLRVGLLPALRTRKDADFWRTGGHLYGKWNHRN